MPKLANIPTNIITGFLGVGKTTAINALLSKKPEGETWAILVNEFGQIGIDQALIEPQSKDVAIKELAGGCICCALGPALTSTLATLIRRTKPDRLIIEPTGIGHPAGIIDTLQSPLFKDVLDLRSIICLVDPRALENNDTISNPIFQDQMNVADVIVLNKTDLANSHELTVAEQHTYALFPPKHAIFKSKHGEIPLALLDLIRNGEHYALFPMAHSGLNEPSQLEVPETHTLFRLEPKLGLPLSKEGYSNGLYSCGWIFNCEDFFNLDLLIKLLQCLPNIQHIKGVFHTREGWVRYNQVINEATTSPIAYRRDSRLEVIATTALVWDDIQLKLVDCLDSSQQA